MAKAKAAKAAAKPAAAKPAAFPLPPAGPVFTGPIPSEPKAADTTGFSGSYKALSGKVQGAEPDEAFKLKIDKDDPMGKTHKLQSEKHFWEGNEEQFRACFEK